MSLSNDFVTATGKRVTTRYPVFRSLVVADRSVLLLNPPAGAMPDNVVCVDAEGHVVWTLQRPADLQRTTMHPFQELHPAGPDTVEVFNRDGYSLFLDVRNGTPVKYEYTK